MPSDVKSPMCTGAERPLRRASHPARATFPQVAQGRLNSVETNAERVQGRAKPGGHTMDGRQAAEALANATRPIQEKRAAEAKKIAAQVRARILEGLAERLNTASTLDEARAMLAAEIEVQRQLAARRL